MYAILHSFAYPLKPLTQVPISIQPIPILHATHNHVLPYPDVAHQEFLSAAFPSGCLTPETLLRCHSIRMSHTRKSFSANIPSEILLCCHSIRVPRTRISSSPPFHPDVSHPESFSADIPSGILLRRHSIWVSHTRISSPPLFHPDVSHPESHLPTFHLFLHP